MVQLALFPTDAVSTVTRDQGQQTSVVEPPPAARTTAPRRPSARSRTRRLRPGEAEALAAFFASDDGVAAARFAALRLGHTLPMALFSGADGAAPPG